MINMRNIYFNYISKSNIIQLEGDGYMNSVIFPGSFDPITKGHMKIVDEVSDMFDEIIIAVMNNPDKICMFTLEERVEIIKTIYEGYKNIKVISSDGYTVDIAMLYQCKAIIRGVRNIGDFTYEMELSNINRNLSCNKIRTLLLFASDMYQDISSSMVKQEFLSNSDITSFVDDVVLDAMYKKYVRR